MKKCKSFYDFRKGEIIWFIGWHHQTWQRLVPLSNCHSKLECFSLWDAFTLTQYFQAKLEPIRVEPYNILFSKGSFLALTANIKLGWKWHSCLPRYGINCSPLQDLLRYLILFNCRILVIFNGTSLLRAPSTSRQVWQQPKYRK